MTSVGSKQTHSYGVCGLLHKLSCLFPAFTSEDKEECVWNPYKSDDMQKEVCRKSFLQLTRSTQKQRKQHAEDIEEDLCGLHGEIAVVMHVDREEAKQEIPRKCPGPELLPHGVIYAGF
ncbi:UNVERIFIED_CONTAM: hypothetical protein K2H54_061041 [Gekko kuhli]